MKNRKGCIKVQDCHIYGTYANYEMLQLLFDKFIPLNVELMDFPSQHRIYYGLSAEFDEVEEGAMPPFYDVQINHYEDKPTHLKFIRL